jgi:hypothetical protein
MTTKITQSIMGIAAVSFILASSTSGIAFAGTYGYWEDPTHTYHCTTSLNDIQHTDDVEPCSDLSVAAGIWNAQSGSDWHFYSVGSGEIPVYGCSTASLGYFVPTPSSADPITDGYVCMSTQYEFGDVPEGDDDVFDYLTLAIHEFGHVPGIDHSWWPQSVMESGQTLNEVKHSLHYTDVWDIEGLYPS